MSRLPGVTSLGEEVHAAGSNSGLLRAQMIWSAESVSVPVEGKKSELAGGAASSEDLHVVFVKEWMLERPPVQATMRLFAYTRYRLYVNGVYLGRGPSRFQNQRPEYDEIDVTRTLRRGKNLIAVLVHRDAPTGRIMRHEPGFAAVLLAGQRPILNSDTTWKAVPELSFGPRKPAWASIEEHVDARKGHDLTNANLSSEKWPSAVAVGGPDFFPVWPRTTPLQKETLRPWLDNKRSEAIVLQAGVAEVFAHAEIVQAYLRLDLEADEGSEIEFLYLLPQGEKSGGSSYVAREGMQRFEGGDTFAFDRLSVLLKSGRVTLHKAEAVEVLYPFERVGEFKSSDPMLDQLWRICARSLEVMSEDSYVDCADRERVEWTDDSPPAFDCTRVMMSGPKEGGGKLWGDSRLLKALLRRIGLTQQADGQLKAHSCSERFDIHAIMEDRSCAWVASLREYWEASEDTAFVREQWPILTRLTAWFLERRTARGLVQAREWEVWDNPLRYQVCEGAGLNALVYKALCDAAILGRVIGSNAESDTYARDAVQLKEDFNRLLWDEQERAYSGALFGPGSKKTSQLNHKVFDGPIVDGHSRPTAQAELFALYCGIVPVERITNLRDWLLAHLDEVKGPMSHYYLFHALYEIQDVAHDTEVLRKIRTGWRPQVDSPWQTTWENLEDKGGSKVHLYGMVPGYFLTAYVLGARRMGSIAERTIVIEPRCGDLQHAEGVAVTEFGPVTMKWARIGNGGLTLECTIPHGARALLRLYKGVGEDIRINAKTVRAVTKGRMIETHLEPGHHVIEYGLKALV